MRRSRDTPLRPPRRDLISLERLVPVFALLSPFSANLVPPCPSTPSYYKQKNGLFLQRCKSRSPSVSTSCGSEKLTETGAACPAVLLPIRRRLRLFVDVRVQEQEVSAVPRPTLNLGEQRVTAS